MATRLTTPVYVDELGIGRQPCPSCGATMILRTTGVSVVFDPLPPQYPTYWWCGCGNEQPGPTLSGRPPDDLARQRWQEAQ